MYNTKKLKEKKSAQLKDSGRDDFEKATVDK